MNKLMQGGSLDKKITSGISSIRNSNRANLGSVLATHKENQSKSGLGTPSSTLNSQYMSQKKSKRTTATANHPVDIRRSSKNNNNTMSAVSSDN